MIRALLLSSSARCSLVSMAPTSLSALASLQHGPHYIVLCKTLLIKELPSMLGGTGNLATIRPIATSAICRSDEENGSTIDNTAMPSEVNMKKAEEKFMKRACVIQGEKIIEQTKRAAAKKVATEKAAVKKEAAARKEAEKRVAAEKKAAKKKAAAEKAAAKKAFKAAAKRAAKEEAISKKEGAMTKAKRKTTLKVATKKSQENGLQKIDVTEKAIAMAAFDHATEKTSDLAVTVNMMDPIQELFLASIRSYRRSEGLPAEDDAAKDVLKAELERVAFRFGFQAGGDATTFPKLEFSDPPVDPIDIFQ